MINYSVLLFYVYGIVYKRCLVNLFIRLLGKTSSACIKTKKFVVDSEMQVADWQVTVCYYSWRIATSRAN